MTNTEKQIWELVHEWCNEQSCEIPDFNRRVLMERILALSQPPVSGSASDFERELYKLINAYVSAGLKKHDLVHKMEYVTQSCRVS